MLTVINERLKELLDTNDNPPELDALFRLRATLVWWKKGLLEPGDWSLRSFLPGLVNQEVMAAVRESGFWKPAMEPIRVRRSARTQRAGVTGPLGGDSTGQRE